MAITLERLEGTLMVNLSTTFLRIANPAREDVASRGNGWKATLGKSPSLSSLPTRRDVRLWIAAREIVIIDGKVSIIVSEDRLK